MGKLFPKKFFIILISTIFLLPFFVSADSQGQLKKFFVDPSFEKNSQEEIEATLEKVSNKAYFYIEKEWLNSLSEENSKKIPEILNILADEFDKKIYPQLTSFYGQEWTPGIDSDSHITILFHPMKEEAAGYFNFGDEYEKIQNPRSNQREIIYLNADNIFYEIIKSYIAHEFVHLITYNQKDRFKGISEEIWLNELRADYAPTLLGYDSEFQGSNLKQRVKAFIETPYDSLTEWQNQKADYGIINLFAQYLTEYYGKDVLAYSMKSENIGIASLEKALLARNAGKQFGEIFSDWAITAFVNDCRFGERYCYKNENLENVRVTPSLIFLPSTQKTDVFLNYSIKQWSGNWYRIIGGEGELKISFEGNPQVQFKIPYVLCQNSDYCEVKFFNLDESQKGTIIISDFGENFTSLTLIPSIQTKTSGFDGREPLFNFSLSISLENKDEEKLIEELKAIIADLQRQIALVQAKILAILQQTGTCGELTKNLYLGMKDFEVNCLQRFLVSQGEDIYPEGIVSGFFGSLTQAAVVRFQEKYAAEILTPLGLKRGTGFVGSLTRNKINVFLSR